MKNTLPNQMAITLLLLGLVQIFNTRHFVASFRLSTFTFMNEKKVLIGSKNDFFLLTPRSLASETHLLALFFFTGCIMTNANAQALEKNVGTQYRVRSIGYQIKFKCLCANVINDRWTRTVFKAFLRCDLSIFILFYTWKIRSAYITHTHTQQSYVIHLLHNWFLPFVL